MIAAVSVRIGKLRGVLAAVSLSVLVVPSAAGSFTGTPAALKLVRQERAAYKAIRAVRDVRTGAVVYCLSAPDGWTYAPEAHCTTPAHDVEEYDLSKGKVVRVVGEVRARGLPTLRYVESKRGWYLTAGGANCWSRSSIPFLIKPLVEFPFPKERLTITKRTRSTIVLDGFSAPSSYREIDYIAPRTLFNYRTVEITYTKHKTYRVVDHLAVLRKPTGAISTPPCGSSKPVPLT
jgi:hypothetical protein